MATISPEFQAIYETGEVLRCDIQNHLSTWPTEKEFPIRGDKLSEAFRLEAESIRDRARQWFNLVALNVLHHTTYDRTYVNLLLRRIGAAIGAMNYWLMCNERTLREHERTSGESAWVSPVSP